MPCLRRIYIAPTACTYILRDVSILFHLSLCVFHKKARSLYYSRNLYSGPFPCTLDPLIIPAVKRLRAKVYQWILWALIWRSLTPLITMTLNPLVWELIGKLIFIHFVMQLLSTFDHALRTLTPKKLTLNTRWGIYEWN